MTSKLEKRSAILLEILSQFPEGISFPHINLLELYDYSICRASFSDLGVKLHSIMIEVGTDYSIGLWYYKNDRNEFSEFYDTYPFMNEAFLSELNRVLEYIE